MKNIVKAVSFILALTMVLAVSGCGKSNVEENEETLKTPEQKVEENFLIDGEKIELTQYLEIPAGADIATLETSLGTIKIAFFPQYAPKAVENFLALAGKGYYNGLKFHRVVSNYLIQSGDPTGTGTGGESSFKDDSGMAKGFENEYSLNLWNFRGALGMVNSGDGTNGSQFYIIQNNALDAATMTKVNEAGFPEKVAAKYKEVGGAPWMDGKCTVFGQVIEGMEVVDAIAAVEVDSGMLPKADVVITKVTLSKK